MTFYRSPFYRNGLALNRFEPVARRAQLSLPAYNVEAVDDDRYAITLAVPGFERSEMTIELHKNVLTISGKKAQANSDRSYLHRGIATEPFERSFNLAEYIEVEGAQLENGLLTVRLVRRIPEQLKPKSIPINDQLEAVTYQDSGSEAA